MLRSPWWSAVKFEQMAFQHKNLLERKAAITMDTIPIANPVPILYSSLGV